MLLLSAMDVGLATASITLGPGFDSYIFVAYYPALALFALVFTSLWLGLAWTTMAAAYALVCWIAGAGLDIDAGDEKVLVGRLAAMYAPGVVRQPHHPVRTHQEADGGGQGAAGCSGNASSSPRRFTTRPRRPPT